MAELPKRTKLEMIAGALRIEVGRPPDFEERIERRFVLENWIAEGRVIPVTQMTHEGERRIAKIRDRNYGDLFEFKVGDLLFRDSADTFPSVKLITDIGLALAAGKDKVEVWR